MIKFILLSIIFLLTEFITSYGMDPFYEEGKKFKEKEIKQIIENHEKWLKSKKTVDDNPLKANFSGANIPGTDFMSLDLAGADFYLSDLTGSFFSDSDLTKANFASSVLTKVDFERANLKDANFSRAKLHSVVFDVDPDSLPTISRIAEAYGLYSLTYERSPAGLYALRKKFKENGYRKQEREITYAIKRNERTKTYNWVENKITFLLFEWTSGWGMKPFKPLLTMIGLIPFFSIIYLAFILYGSEDGIWIRWDKDRVRDDFGLNEPCLIKPSEYKLLSCFKYAFYFSVLSTFHLGWKEVNVGAWINRMRIKEYLLVSTGWSRFVSGTQSLISAYMLALSILTYFGRPFD